MRKTVVLCDRCKKEIAGLPILIKPVTTDTETGDILEDWRPEEFKNRDYCKCCAEKIMAAAVGLVKNEEFEKSLLEATKENSRIVETQELTRTVRKEAEPDKRENLTAELKQNGSTKKRLDIGKIMALKNAGWTNEQIAEELGTTSGTIAVYVCQARKAQVQNKKVN